MAVVFIYHLLGGTAQTTVTLLQFIMIDLLETSKYNLLVVEIVKKNATCIGSQPQAITTCIGLHSYAVVVLGGCAAAASIDMYRCWHLPELPLLLILLLTKDLLKEG